MYLDDTLGTQLPEFLADITMMIGCILEIVVDLNLTAAYFLQQFLIKLSSHSGSDTDGDTLLLCHLTGCAKARNHLLVCCTAFLLPVFSATSEWKESHLTAKEFHRLETIFQKVLIIITSQETLGEEATHRHRRNSYAILTGCCLELFCLLWFSKLVIK